MKVAITGSTGLVGSALVPFLTTGGHEVLRVKRSTGTGAGEIDWDPAKGEMNPARLEGLDAVVHLAGENIAARRWNAAQKAVIRDSRVKGTKLLCETLARLRQPPRVLVSASAIGFYGDRGEEELTGRVPRERAFSLRLVAHGKQRPNPRSRPVSGSCICDSASSSARAAGRWPRC